MKSKLKYIAIVLLMLSAFAQICINNISILSADKKNNIWYAQLKISGDKQIILEEIKKLEKYEINNYIISKNNTENCVIIDICGNE